METGSLRIIWKSFVGTRGGCFLRHGNSGPETLTWASGKLTAAPAQGT